MEAINLNKYQRIIERILSIWAFCIGLFHILLATFQYVINYRDYSSAIRWAGLGLLIASVIYLFLSLVASKKSRTRILLFLRKMCTFEQVLLIGLLLWFFISCWVNQKYGDYLYIRMHDWWLFDVAVSVLILFPMARALGPVKTKKALELIIHIVVISYSVFTIFCLWHIFHLEVVDLPSGEQAGMTLEYELMLGKHYNLTGMIAATLFCLCIYMFFSQDLFWRVIYSFFAFTHLLIIYLSNSRTVFVGTLAFVFVVSFFLSWTRFAHKKLFFRLILSILICATISLLYLSGRNGVFAAFENLTHFREIISSEAGNIRFSNRFYHTNLLSSAVRQTNHFAATIAAPVEENARDFSNLSSRQYVWLAALRTLGSSKFITFFGVTPAGVTEALQIQGLYWSEVAHAHNIFLQLGISMGIPALILFLAFVLRIVGNSLLIAGGKNQILSRNPRLIIAVSAILCFLIINLAEAYLVAYFSVISCFFFLFCGFTLSTQDDEKENRRKKQRDVPQKISAIIIAILITTAAVIYSSNYLNIDHSKLTGEGSKDNPYKIENDEDLKYFRDLVNQGFSFKNCYILQTTDIDLKSKEWVPIGIYNSGRHFEGIYDGGCHTINNLLIEDAEEPYTSSRTGLFGYLKGTVKNLGIESGSIHGYVAGSIAANGEGLIFNCYNKAEVKGIDLAGGICNNLTTGVVMCCVNEGAVSATVTGNLISNSAGTLFASMDPSNINNNFSGNFYPLSMQGVTIQEKLNSGLEELIENEIVSRNNVLFWP